MSAWILCRIVLFMTVCIYPAYYSISSLLTDHSALTDFQYEVLGLIYWFMVVMMLGLYILHLYWTYYLAESFISVKISSKVAKHTYD